MWRMAYIIWNNSAMSLDVQGHSEKVLHGVCKDSDMLVSDRWVSFEAFYDNYISK